ncbi:MAG TPA: hypothetical protein VFR58_03415 [Flavisolibacter sp.]|nr:hypothetical protein [Flavisolibacter sp.]
MKTSITSIIISLLLSYTATGQVEQGFELLQVQKIAEVYKRAPNLSFSTNYTYADSSSPGTILEQMSGITQLQEGRFRTIIDSVECVQGNQYTVIAYLRDSQITVNDRVPNADILKLSLLDSLFRASSVDSLSITNVNDSTRQLTVFFYEQSVYRLYKLRYDKLRYYVRSIEYYLKDVPDGTGTSVGTALIKVDFSNYSTAPLDPSIFNEDRFIYKANGQFMAKPPYEAFQLIVNTIY